VRERERERHRDRAITLSPSSTSAAAAAATDAAAARPPRKSQKSALVVIVYSKFSIGRLFMIFTCSRMWGSTSHAPPPPSVLIIGLVGQEKILKCVDYQVSVANLQHTATHCNTLQRTATHCNTLQHTATLLHI